MIPVIVVWDALFFVLKYKAIMISRKLLKLSRSLFIIYIFIFDMSSPSMKTSFLYLASDKNFVHKFRFLRVFSRSFCCFFVRLRPKTANDFRVVFYSRLFIWPARSFSTKNLNFQVCCRSFVEECDTIKGKWRGLLWPKVTIMT